MYSNFNTSHVNVNPIEDGILTIREAISIHLMLMLIRCQNKAAQWQSNFNTSHVNVNLKQRQQKRNDYIISIHLMLMLILA